MPLSYSSRACPGRCSILNPNNMAEYSPKSDISLLYTDQASLEQAIHNLARQWEADPRGTHWAKDAWRLTIGASFYVKSEDPQLAAVVMSLRRKVEGIMRYQARQWKDLYTPGFRTTYEQEALAAIPFHLVHFDCLIQKLDPSQRVDYATMPLSQHRK